MTTENKGKVLSVRLNGAEWVALQKVCKSSSRGDLSPSELIRLLILREAGRRFKGKSVVLSMQYATDFRNGRPKGNRHTVLGGGE